MDRGPLVRRGVALVVPDHLVPGRVAFPGLQHPHVEVEAIHLGAQDFVVHAMLDGPVRRVDGGEAFAEARKLAVAAREGRGGVIRRAAGLRRLFEGAPFLVQLQQPAVAVDHRHLP